MRNTTVRHHLRRTHKSGVVPVIKHTRGVRAKDLSEKQAMQKVSAKPKLRHFPIYAVEDAEGNGMTEEEY